MSRRVCLEMLGFGCPSCAYAIERTATRIPGIAAVRVDIGARRITVDCDDNPDAIPALQTCIRKLGHDARVVGPDLSERT